MVFDRVVGPPGQHLRHLRPLVSVGSVRQKQDPFFMRHPLHLQDARVEVIMPSLAALFPQPALHELGDEGPALRPILFNKLPDEIVLLLSPGFFLKEFISVVVRFLSRVIDILFGYFLLVCLFPHL